MASAVDPVYIISFYQYFDERINSAMHSSQYLEGWASLVVSVEVASAANKKFKFHWNFQKIWTKVTEYRLLDLYS